MVTRRGRLNKRGNTAANIILIGVLIILGIIGFLYANSAIQGNASQNAANEISTHVVNVAIGILKSTIGLLIGVNGLDPKFSFLKIMVFILISIIIVGTFDSIDVFGEGSTAKWTNFLVGIIISIIGVRFLPHDVFILLTAPSSALVFALMMGLPLVAITFVITNIKVEIIRKIIVATYIIGVGWLFFIIPKIDNEYRIMMIVFVVVALILMFRDSQIIGYIKMEKEKSQLARDLAPENLEAMLKIKAKIKELLSLRVGADKVETKKLNKTIEDLKEKLIEITQKDS